MPRAKIKGNLALDFAGQEAINAICSNLEFAGKNLKRIVITSCEANDGKTFLAMQVGACMARRGKKVLVLDADLRLSEMTLHYDIQLSGEGVGLAHLLTGQCALEEVVYKTNIDNLWLMPDGTDVRAPLSLLATQEFDQLMALLAGSFDLVIVDAPPVGVVIDAAEIAKRCDGSLLVLEHNKTRRRSLQDALVQMSRTGTPVLGCVLNKVSLNRLDSRRYYYRYGAGYRHYGEYSRKARKRRSASGLFGRFGKGE